MATRTINNYLSLIKFSHTIFALPFAVIGFFLATRHFQYPFEWYKLLLVVLCMIFARSAAMAFNRYADYRYDAENPRTVIREIPGGVIRPQSALVFVVVNCLLFIATTWFINPLCFYLSPVALLVVLGYSYTKRFTALCHFVLGVGLGLAPIGAFLAVSSKFELLPVLFGFVVLFWVSGFDIIYALQDEEFDKTQGLNSIPAWLGKQKALYLSDMLHFISAMFVTGAGILAGFGFWYWVATAIFLGLLFYQHTLVSVSDLSRVNLAFFTTNGFASVAFALLVLAELFL
ncbi:MAG: UbiA family prenyltransferase [Sphingobacteriales bacterium]|nr:MAG: UbiA family prenyltransferase [Sphingobacteriales bacterium]